MRLVSSMLACVAAGAGLAVAAGCGEGPAKAPEPGAGPGERNAQYRLLFEGEPQAQAHFARARFLDLPNYLSAEEAARGLKIMDLAVYNAPPPAPPAPPAGATGSAEAAPASPGAGDGAAAKSGGKPLRRIVLEQGRVLGPTLNWAYEWEGGKSGPRRAGTIETPSGGKYTFAEARPAGLTGREFGWMRATAASAPWREFAIDKLELAVEALDRAP